ncbi:MAG TPA: threonine/serine exporter family protein [Thermoanaerobaculia bacterium]|nr:threonine/serine exporter family protein [Thermoanaerobaculia bacterium]
MWESEAAPKLAVAPAAAAPDPSHWVMRLGRALHAAGSPSHRVEEGMELAARPLGIRGQYFSTPTALFASFGSGEAQRTFLERVAPADVDLERLSDLDELLAELADRRIDLPEASRRLDRLAEAPARYGALAMTLAFGLVSAAAAYFFRGGWPEIAAAGALGLAIGLLSRLAARGPATARVFEPVAATLAAAATTAVAAVFGGLSVFVVVLAGLIVLVPGFTLTVSMTELATRHLVAGSARFAGAGATFFGLAFGVAVGTTVAEALVGAPPALDPVAAPEWVRWPALVVAAVGLTILFRARPRDGGWVFTAGLLATEGVRLGGLLLGPQLAAFLGALLVGAAGNLLARLLRRPAALLQVPGLLLLVPGSLGFRSLSSLLHRDVLSGVHTAFEMTLVAIALTTGLLLAGVVVPPRRAL